MKVLLRIVIAGVAATALMLLVTTAWLYLDSSGIPDTHSLNDFAPATATQVTDGCNKSNHTAIPYDSIGTRMRAALNASGLEENGPGALVTMFRGVGPATGPHPVAVSLSIARTMICEPGRPLYRSLNEVRIALQLERRFTRRELLTIEANRLYFGEGAFGVEAASQHYFHKEPNQLRTEEAALLAGLPQSPSRFSPTRHPDRALERRSEVIDAMLHNHSLSDPEAETAKAAPLLALNE
jgi:penicillin-binding protein 1A